MDSAEALAEIRARAEEAKGYGGQLAGLLANDCLALLARLAEAEERAERAENGAMAERLRFRDAEADRGRYKAALERIAEWTWDRGYDDIALHDVQAIAREALNPRPTSIRAHIDQEGST